jgi:hypothetical protein
MGAAPDLSTIWIRAFPLRQVAKTTGRSMEPMHATAHIILDGQAMSA